jgi:perosamine synthetase
MSDAAALAINGGPKVRTAPMPARFALGHEERAWVDRVFEHYGPLGVDPGYQGHFESLYCAAFERFMGGGHADAVATGTSALYVALAALGLPAGSEVLVSPITDPGSISAIVLNNLVPRIVDTQPGSYNVGPDEVAARIGPKVRAAMIVHSTGQSADIAAIAALLRERGIKLIEDCSQSHGASSKGRKVGTVGDIAAFSTMYRKAHVTGASGGIVYSRDEALFRQALAHADRGKPRWRTDFDDRDPSNYLFPALNHHTDEISCAIGIASLGRLGDTIAARLAYVEGVCRGLAGSNTVRPRAFDPGDSPFVHPVFVDVAGGPAAKRRFAEAVRAEGIPLNPHYMYVVHEWPWVRPYLADNFDCPNAYAARDSSFCLYLNEKYGEPEIRDTVSAILKVARVNW